MCISAAVAFLSANAGAIGAGAAAVGAAGSLYSATRKAPNPAAAQARADAMAAQGSNARLAARRKALANNSLVTGDVMSTGVLNGGRPTLGA
jgi:hypothetical protein